jgi:glycosyltransferase involved in cell wall biosynthesis
VPYDATNASVRTRVVHWLDRIARADGVPVDSIASIVGPGFDGHRDAAAERVLVARNVSRFSRGRREAALLRGATLGVYDLDDGLPWDDGRLPDLGRWWKRPWPRSLIARRAADAADRVIVGNEVLAAWASEHCDDVRIVPTCVEPDDYVVKAGHDLGGPPVIGWIGSPATEIYLRPIAAALAELHRTLGARFEMISGPGEVPPEMAPFTTRTPWSLEMVSTIGERWDVGVMPLADGVYERAKCGYKLLQYGAAGLPSIGSPVGVNARLLDDLDGLAPVDASGWIEALRTVLTEPASRRARRGLAGRAVAAAHSYERWEPAWRDAVGIGAAGGRP